MIRPVRSLAPLAAALLLTAAPGLAAPPAAPAPAHPAAAPAPVDVRSQLSDTARRAWDAAKQLAGASDYKGALVEFRRTYDLSHDPRVLYNVGVTEKLLTHYARAVDAWERELKEGAAELGPAEVTEIRNAIAIVQQFVTIIDVVSTEDNATLTIDDVVVGKTPFASPVHIDVGKRTVKLTKEGFLDSTQTVDAATAQRASVTFKLEPVSKTALVTVSVGGAPGATVVIDGKDMGPAPFNGTLTAEKHTIEARAPGFVAVGQTVDVQYKTPVNLVLTLSAERHQGRLHVTAPDGAQIALDQRIVGSGTWEGVVSTTGSHQLVVTKPGFQTYSADIDVADDQTRDVNVPLNAVVGTSWVAWSIGSLLVVTGGIVAGYFIFQPATPGVYLGNLPPQVTTGNVHSGGGVRF
jgi:PEGA domain